MRLFRTFVLLTLLALPSVAQPPTAGIVGYTDSEVHKVSGSDLPFYFVVRAFFEQGVGWLNEWGTFYQSFLAEFEIEAGSPAAAAVTAAMLRAEPRVRAHAAIDPALAEDPQAFLAAQLERIKEDAAAFAVIYADLLVSLEKAGYSVPTLERFLEVSVRQQSGLIVIGESKAGLEKSRGGVAAFLDVADFEDLVFGRLAFLSVTD